MKIGLVGVNTAQGLGYLNRDLVKFLDIEKWLILPHRRFPMLSDVEGTRIFTIENAPTPNDIKYWLEGLDVVLFAESIDPIPDLPRIARQLGIKVVCIPMVENIPLNKGWYKQVDLWIAPTAYSYKRIPEIVSGAKVVSFPWPIDTDAFPFKQRTTVKRYVYAQGNAGPKDRKGGWIVAEAAKLVPDIPIIVYSQVQIGMHSEKLIKVNWPKHIDFRGATNDPASIYQEGDVFIMPSRWEGLGLSLYECQAAGMPLITTAGPPMNEANPWKKLPCTVHKENLRKYDIDSYWVSPEVLAQTLRECFETDILEVSQKAHDWVVANRSWNTQAERLQDVLTDWAR